MQSFVSQTDPDLVYQFRKRSRVGLDSEDDPLLNADTMKMIAGGSGYNKADDERVLLAV